MANHPNRGRGAPSKSPEDRVRRFNISLPPDVADMLDAMPGDRSSNIAQLVRNAPKSGDQDAGE